MTEQEQLEYFKKAHKDELDAHIAALDLVSAQTAEINRLKAVQVVMREALEDIARHRLLPKDREPGWESIAEHASKTTTERQRIAFAALEKVRKAGGANE